MLLTLLLSTALASPAAEIRLIPNDSAWAPQVRLALLMAHDANDSGVLESAEIADIDCPTWVALDDAVREAWSGRGMFETYGFVPEHRWTGWAWGLSSLAKEQAYSQALTCGITLDEGPPSESNPGRARATTVDRVRGADASSADAWVAAVSTALLDAYDTDGSRQLDTLTELGAVDCDVWKAMDTAVRDSWQQSLRRIYGFEPDYTWAGGLLGLAESMRTPARVASAACGVGKPIRGTATVIAELPDPGSDSWDAFVWRTLIVTYDADNTGQLDATDEVGRVPCDVWKALDVAVRERWGNGLMSVYGFYPEGTWLGSQLGLSPAMRSAALESGRQCGLQLDLGAETTVDAVAPATPQGATPAARIASIAGAPAWDSLVRTEMVDAYDADHNNRIDSGKEVKAIPCTVWAAMDAHVSKLYQGTGVRAIYGFAKGFHWKGHVLGFDEKARKAADKAMDRCQIE